MRMQHRRRADHGSARMISSKGETWFIHSVSDAPAWQLIGPYVLMANQISAKTIALVGFDGGILHREATCSILVPVDSTPQTEAIHLVIEHLLMSLIKEELAQGLSPS